VHVFYDIIRLSREARLTDLLGKARDGLYEPVLADSEREAVADLLQYLENVSTPPVCLCISPLNLLTVTLTAR
jgi:hypothetical protein